MLKRKQVSKLSVVLICFGILMMGFIKGMHGLTVHHRHEEIQGYENHLNSHIMDEESKSLESGDIKVLKNTDPEIMVYNTGDPIGVLSIQSIELNAMIVEGVGEEQLKGRLGHFEKTALPGCWGNFSIAGHSSTVYDELLDRINTVGIGEKIEIVTVDGDYTYVITEMFVVEPREVGVLIQDNSKKTMTIVTCTNEGKRRLIVKAEMEIEVDDKQEVD